MNSLIDDVPIRGRASVDLMSLDSIVLNADDGLCRDRRRVSALGLCLGLGFGVRRGLGMRATTLKDRTLLFSPLACAVIV